MTAVKRQSAELRLCCRMPSFAVLGRATGVTIRAPQRLATADQESAMGDSPPDTPPSLKAPEDRLDSWKEIAAYLNRDVTTVQRWEKREAMPVHRHLHERGGSVYASRAELDAWARNRNLPAQENGRNVPASSH